MPPQDHRVGENLQPQEETVDIGKVIEHGTRKVEVPPWPAKREVPTPREPLKTPAREKERV